MKLLLQFLLTLLLFNGFMFFMYAGLEYVFNKFFPENKTNPLSLSSKKYKMLEWNTLLGLIVLGYNIPSIKGWQAFLIGLSAILLNTIGYGEARSKYRERLKKQRERYDALLDDATIELVKTNNEMLELLKTMKRNET
jgi:hypothetical protein